MELFAPELRDYLDSLAPVWHPEVEKMEAIAKDKGFPIIGRASGQLCYLLSRMLRARRVFELGSGYGYSTAWFARAVSENGGGEVFHVVWDEELSAQARAHMSALDLPNVEIRYNVAEAVQTLEQVDGSFDVIFNDIDKADYPSSLPAIESKLRPGGLLIIDNMLWSGKIFDPENNDPETEGVREFTNRISKDPNWIVTLVPIRDGVIVAMKR